MGTWDPDDLVLLCPLVSKIFHGNITDLMTLEFSNDSDFYTDQLLNMKLADKMKSPYKEALLDKNFVIPVECLNNVNRIIAAAKFTNFFNILWLYIFKNM